MREVLIAVERAADAGNRLLITGETGSGKEMVARAYQRSSAPRGPFVPLNCAALPPALAESLLFGTTRGAFSGAATDRVGYIAQADGGVLFLDEIAELDQEVQAKLLRVLETGEVLALGSSRHVKVNVRFCAATHQDLLAQTAQGTFRTDLYYRLAESQIRVPPIRERREEIPWFIATELLRLSGGLAPHRSFVEACLSNHWRGNARELVAAIRSAGSRANAERGTLVRREHLLLEDAARAPELTQGKTQGSISAERLEATLLRHSGNVTRVAQELGLHRTQVYRLFKRFGLRTQAENEAEIASAENSAYDLSETEGAFKPGR